MTTPAPSTAREAAEHSLNVIARLDAELRAFVHVDTEAVFVQTDRLDTADDRGPLHGVTVGVKDVFDTADAPTERGSPIFRGRRPDRDAACVALLRDAGAVLVGKTATAELACMSPAATRNPHGQGRTPGGSSSGSAAAVAAGMVEVALGTQTAASISRPASFCGVVGYKPTFGAISRSGVLECAQSLDTVGVLARDVARAAAVASVMMRQPSIAALDEPPTRVAMLLPYAWAQLDESVADAVRAAGTCLGSLGADVSAIDVSGRLVPATMTHRVIMRYEIARAFAPLYDRNRGDLSDILVELIDEGQGYDVSAYAEAQTERLAIAAEVARIFEYADVVIAPAASGEAPQGLESTGDPACSAPWTMLGLPIVTVPTATGPAGMPIGVNVIAPLGADRLALSAARVLAER